MRTKFLKKLVTGVLVAALTLTSTVTVDANAAAKKTVTVKTQASLDKALEDKTVTEIVIKTTKQVKLYIGRGDYTGKQLVINSPKAAISNKGTLKVLWLQMQGLFQTGQRGMKSPYRTLMV